MLGRREAYASRHSIILKRLYPLCMIMRKKIIIALLLLMSIQLSTLSLAQTHVIGVGGYVFFGGSPVEGATVTVTNENTGQSVTTTTNSQGLYAVGLFANTGDKIVAVASYGNQTGTANRTADLSLVTNWLNISLGGGLVARFSYYPPNPQPGQPVHFIDRSDGNIITWLWNFGDGTTGTGKNPTHTYESEGDFKVVLEVRDPSGNFDRTSQVIHVRAVTENPYIPEPQKPVYLPGYSIKEMCDLLRISNLSKSSNKVRVVFIDSGVSPRIYQVNDTMLDLSKIKRYTVTGDTEDKYGHGTSVGAILLYILTTKVDNYELICIKAFDKYGQSTEKAFIDAMELAEKLHPDVVSISAGSIPSERDLISRKAEKLTHAGIVVVASAGNSGPDLDTILSPAINPYVLAIGAENPERTILNLKDDTICAWSSRGSPALKKPNCVAPGESIRLPWGKTEERVMSGTSFSAPFVAGGIAVAISKNRGLYDLVKTLYFWDGTIVTNAVKSAVEETCYPKGVYYVWGAGIAQFDKLPGVLHAKLMTLLILFIILLVVVIGIISVTVYLILKRRRFPKW